MGKSSRTEKISKVEAVPSVNEKKHLLIGASHVSSVSASFNHISSDYLSLHDANDERCFESYDWVIFWPDRTTFDYARNKSTFKKARKRFPEYPFQSITWEELHPSESDIPALMWKDSRPDLECHRWVTSRCYSMMRPLVERIMNGGSPVIVVADPSIDFIANGLFGWFCKQLCMFPTRQHPASKYDVRYRCDDLSSLFSYLHELYDHWDAAFSVQQAVQVDEFPIDLIGKQVAVNVLTSDREYDSADQFWECNNDDAAYSGVHEVVGLAPDSSGKTRAVMMKSGASGIVVVPKLTKPDQLLNLLEVLPIRNISRILLPVRMPDGKTANVFYKGKHLDVINTGTTLFRIIEYMSDKNTDWVGTKELSEKTSCQDTPTGIQQNSAKNNRPLYNAIFESDNPGFRIRVRP